MKCECGYPFRPRGRKILEGFTMTELGYDERCACEMCGRITRIQKEHITSGFNKLTLLSKIDLWLCGYTRTTKK